MLWPSSVHRYLKACMKELRFLYPEDTYKLSYADDVNFISKDSIKINEIEKILRQWGLKLNKNKTEEILISEGWKKMKFLESCIGTLEDKKRIKAFVTLAMNKLNGRLIHLITFVQTYLNANFCCILKILVLQMIGYFFK